MTTYIGRTGRMAPAGCVSGLSTGNEQRVVFGGGEGTLSPRRARLQGTGGRTWSASVGVGDLAAANAVNSLARSQALYGGSYRVIPCDAVDHNMFTPRASEELWDWTGLSVGPASSFPTVTGAEGVFPAMLGRVTSGNVATSPMVPLPKLDRLYGQVYVAGSGQLRIHSFDATGSSFTPVTVDFSLPSNTLVRVSLDRSLTANHAAAQLRIAPSAEAPVYFAWPSLAYADNPYVTGRGCDKAYLSMPSRDLIGTWGTGLESHSYQIVEVGA